MEFRSSRSQILIRGDNHSPSTANQDIDTCSAYPRQLSNLFSDNVYLSDPWHDDIFLNQPDDDIAKSTWRLKDRMKTAGVALVLCLNLGTDPPDVVKPAHSARRECWFDPTGPKQKGLEVIGNALQQQYERWQSKAKYKQCLDPTSEDLRRLCINLRKAARTDRLLFHYNGHGVPRPTKNGELWVFGKHYTHYMPVAIIELRSWLGDPAIYVLDCSGAGALLPHFMDLGAGEKEKEREREREMKGSSASGYNQFMTPSNPKGSAASLLANGGNGNGNIGNGTGAAGGGGGNPPVNNSSTYSSSTDYNNFVSRQASTPFSPSNQQAGVDSQTIVLAACRANEILPLSPLYPADLFTCCLTTPIPIALRWFILQNPHSMGDISVDLSENIPGDHSDRKTPRGELHWIFTAVTDTIAWNTLPSNVFQKLFREDLLAASLFRNFLLAKRLMKSLNCSPQSWPPLPDSSTHLLWQTWDLAAESCLFHISSLQRGAAMTDPRNNQAFSIASNSTFFTDHLTAFEIWLDFGEKGLEAPMHLPILLQVLLSQTHRLRALQLLRRYLSLGSYAVNLSLVVGIFPYVLKLLQSPAGEVRQLLVSIWASILGFDPSCRQELVRDKMQGYFIQYILAKEKDMPPAQRCMAAFVLAEICNGYREGQHSCLQQGLHRTCTGILKSFLDSSPPNPGAGSGGSGSGGGGGAGGGGAGSAVNSVSGSKVLPSGQGDAGNGSSNSNCKLWISLCLFKLSEDFPYAKYLIFTEAGHSQLYPLLQDPDVTVRASSVLALGELFGASGLAPSLAESAHIATHAPPAVNISLHTPQQKGFPGSNPGMSSMGSGAAPGGGGRPHPSAPSSSVTVSPFGVSASALSAHGQQTNTHTQQGRAHAPSPAEFGAFGAAHPAPNPAQTAGHPSSSGSGGGGGGMGGVGSAYAVFQGRRVTVLSVEQMELLEAELLLATQLLESCKDGSVLVRREAVIALSKFVILPHHVSCIKLVASGLLLEARGGDKSRSVSSNGLSAAVSGKGIGLGEVKDKEGLSSSGAGGTGGTGGAGGVGSLSARGASSSGTISSSSTPKPDDPQNGKSAVSDPWQLSLPQSQRIVDRLAQYLRCVGYPTLPERDGMSLIPSEIACPSSLELRQPIPKLPTQMPPQMPISIKRDEGKEKPLPLNLSLSLPAGDEVKKDELEGEEGEICKSVVMARAYVRLWLALSEVQGRDPHSLVATAAALVIRRVTTHLERDLDRTQRNMHATHTTHTARSGSLDRSGSQSPSSRTHNAHVPHNIHSTHPTHPAHPAHNPRDRDTPSPGPAIFSPSFGALRGKSPSFINTYNVGGSDEEGGSNPWDKGGPILPPGSTPMTPQEMGRRRISNGNASPGPRMGTRTNSTRGPSPGFGPPRPASTEIGGAGPMSIGAMGGNSSNNVGGYQGAGGMGGVGGPGGISASSLAGINGPGSSGSGLNYPTPGPYPNNPNGPNNPNYPNPGPNNPNRGRMEAPPGLDLLEEEDDPVEYEADPALTSCLYAWSRKLFLAPSPGYEPYSDPLSVEGCSRLYRDAKLNEILRHEQSLSETFKYVDDKEDLLQLDRKTKEDLQSAKTTMVAALPSSVTKFEQKAVLNIETTEVTSLVMFHSFHDILAVSDGYGVGIWSLADGTRILQIPSASGPRHNSTTTPSSSYRDNYKRLGSERERGGSNVGDRDGSLSARTPKGLGGVSVGLGAGLSTQTGPLVEGAAGQALGTAGIAAAVAGRTRTGSFSLTAAQITPPSSLEGVARVTAMLWINESYESLLLMGSDDGSVKVWKDSADTEAIAAHNNSQHNQHNQHTQHNQHNQQNQSQTDSQRERDIDRSASSSNVRDGPPRVPTPGLSTTGPSTPFRSIYGGFYNNSEAGNTGASLASAFVALPDVAQDSRGSGMVLSWIQPSGTLVAGGNSSTIRVWDVGREQCVRVFDTGLDTCTTAIASRTVAIDFSSGPHISGYPFSGSPAFSPSPFRASNEQQLVSWTFAGSADGTVSVFDERVPSSAAHGGRVHCSRDHSAWIVSAHLRADGVPEVITGSVRGVVKFWDLRSMRAFKTFEVHKSPLTALAVHSCAPIIATGSHAQFIKILTLGGDQLGSIIKYHDGFLGQRIGPVSCLTFHPTRMRLAAGATDSIVSIYTTASDM